MEEKRTENVVKIAKEIYSILCREKCTVGEATEALRQVGCVLIVAPTVQENECSEKMFTY